MGTRGEEGHAALSAPPLVRSGSAVASGNPRLSHPSGLRASGANAVVEKLAANAMAQRQRQLKRLQQMASATAAKARADAARAARDEKEKQRAEEMAAVQAQMAAVQRRRAEEAEVL